MREAVRRKIITYSNLVTRMTGFCQAELGVSAVLCHGESQIKDWAPSQQDSSDILETKWEVLFP